MTKLIMLKGLPASGKSTYAKTLVSQGYKRVNRDDLRNMIDSGVWSKENEQFVVKLEQDTVQLYLGGLHNVVVDDTNLSPKNEIIWKTIANAHNAQFEVKDFTDVPVTLCLKRDQERANSVGSKVILGMYDRYLNKKTEKRPLEVLGDPSLPLAIIFDMDGTLAHISGRGPYESEKCESDLLNHPIAMLADAMRHYQQILNESITTLVVSGRKDNARAQTEAWLQKNNIGYDALFMRKSDDDRKDSIVKQEILDNQIKNNYRVIFVVDDRQNVVDMWRKNGLTCLQCDYGLF